MVWTGDSRGHLAKSLVKLLAQIDAFAPNRKKDWDGSIASAEHHQQNPTSDHEIRNGVVRALDITHDPAHGVNVQQIADQIRLSGDRRVSYLIHNGKISNPDIQNWAWRNRNKGADDHTHHLHVSVKEAFQDDVAEWKIKKTDGGSAVQQFPLLLKGSQGAYVRELQQLLDIHADGNFGDDTLAAVKEFQKERGLVVDGEVGPATWQALFRFNKPGRMNMNIKSTVFNDTNLAYGPVPASTIGFSLPAVMPPGTLLWVQNRANGNVAVGPVIDKGPWYDGSPNKPSDFYWELNRRPRAETDPNTNHAGLDMYPEAAKALGVEFVERGGKIISGEAQVDWGFVPLTPGAPDPEPEDTLEKITADLQDIVRRLGALQGAPK